MMQDSQIWLMILLIGAGTFLMRFSFIFALEYAPEPKYLARILRFVPPAVLAALVTSGILIRNGDLVIDWGNQRLWAALIATIIAWKTRNILLTIVVGLVTLMILQTLLN